MDIVIIGCAEENSLRRYEDDQRMYENCDIVIEMLDSAYWGFFQRMMIL